MVALHGIVGSRLPRARVAVAAAAATCFAFSTGLVAAVDLTRLDSTQRLATIRDTLAGVDADARIAVRVDDEWDQSWSVYYLRDRPLTVTAPNIFLTGFGIDQPAFARGTADLVLEQGGARSAAVWRGDGLVLRRADGEGASG